MGPAEVLRAPAAPCRRRQACGAVSGRSRGRLGARETPADLYSLTLICLSRNSAMRSVCLEYCSRSTRHTSTVTSGKPTCGGGGGAGERGSGRRRQGGRAGQPRPTPQRPTHGDVLVVLVDPRADLVLEAEDLRVERRAGACCEAARLGDPEGVLNPGQPSGTAARDNHLGVPLCQERGVELGGVGRRQVGTHQRPQHLRQHLGEGVVHLA
jgi:hypothetical protein